MLLRLKLLQKNQVVCFSPQGHLLPSRKDTYL